MTVQLLAKPFVKWAGGKGQLLPEIQKTYAVGLGTKCTKYAEPFVGGGAVLFDVLNKFQLESVYISDINRELILTYTTIRDSVRQLIVLLQKLQEDYIPLETAEREIYYYAKRKQFNELKLKKMLSKAHSVECAALFIFLNKTCFNGLYRVNRKGEHNVPMGAYKNPAICNSENLQIVSEKLQKVQIFCTDYKQSYDFIDRESFVYIDPPYRPIAETSNFTSYTEFDFDDIAQEELASFVTKINQKGAKIVVSNSDPKNYNDKDNFFDMLYSDHHIQRVAATRMINSDSSARGRINELLITNFIL